MWDQDRTSDLGPRGKLSHGAVLGQKKGLWGVVRVRTMSVLAREEYAAEAIVRLMPRLSRDQFCQRMAALGDHPNGRVSQAYASWLLLRVLPPSEEKTRHWEEMTARLRQALDEKKRNE